MRRHILSALLVSLFAAATVAQPFDSGSDGSDGALSINTSTVIDLSLADGTPGNGTFDPALNAVVFNFTTISIAGSTSVTFVNHPSGAPVVWLASGDVTIAAGVFIALDGGPGQSAGSALRVAASAGPGGFPGGFGGAILATRFPSGGYGPGGPSIDPSGGGKAGSGGSYATIGTLGTTSINVDLGPTYGNIFLLPLIGGSGGAGGWGTASTFGGGGGGGGGAILIASSGTITMNGSIRSLGGAAGSGAFFADGGSGAGGGLRLVANTIVGTGSLQATGSTVEANGGDGRIRVEANTISLSNPGIPPFTSGTPGLVFPPLNAPTLKATMVGAQVVPADPTADVETVDVTVNDSNPLTVQIEATNIPVGTTVDVRVVAKQTANSFIVTSTPLAGTMAMSTATADVTFPPGLSDVQLSATFMPAAALAAPKVPGEKGRKLAKGASEVQSKTGKKPTAVASNSTSKRKATSKQAVAAKRTGNALPRYRRVNAIVGVEMGPGPEQMTYTTATGRRVTYPADLLANASQMLRTMRGGRMAKPAGRAGR